MMNLSRDKFITFAKLTNVPFLMAHELCHYTVARAVGFQAKLGLAHVSFESDNPHTDASVPFTLKSPSPAAVF